MIKVKTKGFLHITIGVTDLARSTAFYRDVLGCELMNQNKIMSFFRTGDDMFVLTKFDRYVCPNPAQPPDRDTTLFHHAFLVDDADYDQAVAQLEREGVPTWNCTAMGHSTFPGRRHIYFNDPDGNSVELATLLPSEVAAPAAVGVGS
jgi:catechol 2,3-dioxygenase-like lactoylglutathione lyase family enzyme